MTFPKVAQNTQKSKKLKNVILCTGATDFCTLRLFRVKFDPYLFRWIIDLPVWVKSRKIVVLGNLETVKLYKVCFVCILCGTVVTVAQGELDSVTRTVCVPTTSAQIPTETDTCWSLRGYRGTSKQ